MLALPMLVLFMVGFVGINAKAIGSTKDTATVLSLNNEWSEKRSLSEDGEHWYKFTMAKDGYISFKMMSYFHNLWWTVYNDDLSWTIGYSSAYYSIGGTESSPQTGYTGWYVLSAGDYYIKLTGNGDYKIASCLAHYYDNNNDQTAISYDSPKTIKFGVANIGDFTQNDYGADWYKVTVDKEKTYVLTIISYFNWLKYEVYNYDLSYSYGNFKHDPVGGSHSNPESKKNELSLAPGTYYIKLSRYFDNNFGQYKSTFEPLSKDNCSHDYQKEVIAPTYFASGYIKNTCKKCGDSYKSNTVSKKKLDGVDFSKYYTKNRNKKVTLNWSLNSDASGYEIEYSTNKNFKKSLYKKNIKGKKYKTTITKGLKKNKKYYFRIRSYVKKGGNTVYSKWSKKYAIKVK